MNNVFIIKDSDTGLFWNKTPFPHWREHPFIYPKKANAQSAINYHRHIMQSAVILEFSLTEVRPNG